MFGLRAKGGPDQAFVHADDCKIMETEPGTKIPWNEIESGRWEARCVCNVQYVHEAPVNSRVRLDPLDPGTSRHMPQCEHRDTTDPALLRAILRVRDAVDGTYWVVECGVCETFWQVPHYAAGSVG